MPTKTKKTAHARSLLAAIQNLVSTLPTAAERDEAIRALRSVEEYLAEVRTWLEVLPTSSDAPDLQFALERLDTLVDKAEENPLLARVFGDAPKAKPRKNPPPPKADENRARSVLAVLEDLTIDQVREKLQNDSDLTLRDLRAVAGILELRHPSKINRETLANQLTMRIANQRGYRHLSGEREVQQQQASDKAVEHS